MICPKCSTPSVTDTCGLCGWSTKNLREVEQLAFNQGFVHTDRRTTYNCPACGAQIPAERWERTVVAQDENGNMLTDEGGQPIPAVQGVWIPIFHREPQSGKVCPDGF